MLIVRAHVLHATWPRRTRVEDKEEFYLAVWDSKDKDSLTWLIPVLRILF